MQVTRRYWTAVALGGLLTVAALVFAQPLLLVGAASIGAWLLVHQLLFVRTIGQQQAALTVTQTPTRTQLPTDEETTINLIAARSVETAPFIDIHLTIEAGLPAAATPAGQSAGQLTLATDADHNATTVTVHWPVAGQFQFDPPTITATDQYGLFHSTFPAPTTSLPTITVVPPHPQNVHVGQGGEQVTTAFGTAKTGDFGRGLEPGGVREYTAGDTLRQIDWNATARSTTPHVREFEAETDQQRLLLIDHRPSMAVGPAGRTKLDFARHVALAITTQTQADRHPLGLYTIADEGITHRTPPAADADVYTTIQTALHELTTLPTAAAASPASSNDSVGPRTARQTAERLHPGTSAFATRLHPFFATAQPYVQRIDTKPLYNAIQTAVPTLQAPVSTILVTDDQNRGEVREAVKLAQTQSRTVRVFLTPTVLFEPDGVTDFETAYDRYTDFEEFRRDLARLDGVTAFEVAPGDKLEALLATTAATQSSHQ